MLIECHKELKAKKASSGVDDMTKLEYEASLETNIEDLLKRMKALKYRPKPVKRVYIPKVRSN
jgi:retron-type reverse transcriptase